MTLISVQCPNCGSPVEAPHVGAMVGCPSCGSTLSIKQGSSGHPLAVLISINRDTSFIARRQAAQRLREQLEALHRQRSEAASALASARAEANSTGCAQPVTCGLALLIGAPGLVIVFVLFGAVALETTSAKVIAAIIAILLGIAFYRAHESTQWEAAASARSYEARLSDLARAIRSRTEELQRLEAELDRLTDEM